jgi:hypothetical protein
MSRMTQETVHLDSLCLDSDVESAFRSYRPSQTAIDYQGVVPEDGVALSQESSHEDEDDDGLCSSFMAAWE